MFILVRLGIAQARIIEGLVAGTRLLAQFIENFWCPTVSSEELMKGLVR